MNASGGRFFIRHKKLTILLVFLVLAAVFLLRQLQPRPLLTGRDLRSAQDAPIRVWKYTGSTYLDVTEYIDRDALIDRLTQTRCTRFIYIPNTVNNANVRYEIKLELPDGAIRLPVGAPQQRFTTNYAYRSISRGFLTTVWHVLDYESLIGFLDSMTAQA